MSTMLAHRSTGLAAPGTLSSIHKVYEDPYRPNKWTTESPERAGPPVEDAESAQHALVVRYKLSENPGKELDLHSIVVQSPSLKKVLARVLDGYPGITLELERLEFNAPFECFIHRWEKLLAVREELFNEPWHSDNGEDHKITFSHLEMLHSTLSTELASTLRTKQDLVKNGVITPLHVWMIFEPGCLIYTKNEGHDRVYKLQTAKWETQNKRRIYKLECEFVDYDGVGFGMNKESLAITAWKGTKKITKLEAFPYQFHEDIDTLQDRLIVRGRKFETYKGFHFVAYNGVAIGKVNRGEAKFDVNSRIIIDSAASSRYNTKVTLEYLETEEIFADAPNRAGGDEDTDDDCVVLGEEIDNTHAMESGKRPVIDTNTKSVLNTEQLLLTDAKLRGYSLRDKKWMNFYIDNIQDIKWNEDAFDSLVAPQEQKDLILAFAESQAKNHASFDDFIQGKGKGIILLMSGPPGVGKTLTAESVAECMKVPLYSIGAAELGSKPANLEKKLEDILVMCAKWNAGTPSASFSVHTTNCP